MSQSIQPIFVPFPSSQLGGAIVVNFVIVLSTVAVVSVILRVFWLAVQRNFFNVSTTTQECVFFHTQLGHYAACLIIGMMFNAIAGIIGIQWYFHSGITDGWTCRTQAFVMQIGNFSAGYFTTAIAVHTFNSLVLRMRQSVIICRSTIMVGWVWAGLIASAPFLIHGPDGYVYGADGFSCGVRSVYPKSQFLFHLLPIFIASALGTILYSLIFLVLRGTLKIKGGIKLTLNPDERWIHGQGFGENYDRFIARVAKSMLWYPIAYVVLLVPYAGTRLFWISGFKVPSEAVLFASACWYTLGFVDVLLLYNTFRVLGPAFDACSAVSSRQRLSSFGSAGDREKCAPSRTLDQWREMQEKIHQYRAQTFDSPRSFSRQDSWSRSLRNLFPLHLGRNMTTSDSNSSYSNTSVVDHPITPAGFKPDITLPPQAVTPVRQICCDFGEYGLGESLTMNALAAPPRQTQTHTPVLNQLLAEPTNSLSKDGLCAVVRQ